MDIYCSAPGNAPLSLASASAPVTDLKFSGDGELLAYLVQTAVEAYELWVVPVDASAPARLLVDGTSLARPDSAYTYSPYRPVWRGDTHEIYFTSYTGGLEGPGERANYDLWKVDADSIVVSQLLTDWTGIVTLSPNGQYLTLSQPEFIELRNYDGSNPQNLLSFPMIMTYSEYAYRPEISWTPDSSSLVVGVPSEDPLANDSSITFYRFTNDGSSTTLGTVMGNFVFGGLPRPTLSPDGQLAIYGVNVNNEVTLHLARTNGTLNTILDTYPGNVLWAGWAPDSLHYAYALEPAGGFAASVPDDPAPFFPSDIRVSHAAWLNNSTLAYAGDKNGTWGLYVQSLNGSPRTIVEGLSTEPYFTTR